MKPDHGSKLQWRDYAMRPEFPKVCVIGLGYIGLPTAALIAAKASR